LTVREQVKDTLDGKESVGILLLADTFHEDGEVVMVVELVHLNLPSNLVGGAVLNLDGQISTVVETAELTGRDRSSFDGTSLGGQSGGPLDGLVQGADLTSGTLATLGVGYSD